MEKITEEMKKSNEEIADLLRRSAKTSRVVEALIQQLSAPSIFFHSNNQQSTGFTVASAPITTTPAPESEILVRK